MPLPKLIFGEDHCDLITVQILSALLPKLKELGYLTFLEELSTEIGLEYLRKNLNMCSAKYTFDTQNNPNFYDLKQEIALALNQFLQRLIEQQMTWYGIEPLPAHLIDLSEEEYIAFQPFRDSYMANAYASEEFAFGRVGLSHITGIKQYLIESLGEEKVSQDFRIFYIDRGEKIPRYIKENLPNDLIIIDAVHLSHEEIINIIIETIELAQQQFQHSNFTR